MIIPIIGVKGIFTLLPPLEQQIAKGGIVECDAVRSFGDVIKQGRDPYTAYYEPLGLPKADYEQHAREGGYIVTLLSESGRAHYIPAHYIKSAPMPGGLAYEVLALVADLGPIEKGRDLTYLTTKITNVITDNMGITPRIEIVKISDTQYFSSDDAQAMEQARENGITDRLTDSTKLVRALDENDRLRAENQALKDYIASL